MEYLVAMAEAEMEMEVEYSVAEVPAAMAEAKMEVGYPVAEEFHRTECFKLAITPMFWRGNTALKYNFRP